MNDKNGRKLKRIFSFQRAAGWALVLAAAGVSAIPIAARPLGDIPLFETLAKGSWTLRIRDDQSQERICVRNGTEFIQLRHREPGCNQFLVKNTQDEVVVQYTCRSVGYGRTTVRRESRELIQIQSQGFRDGRPFSFSGEARLTGRC